MPSSNITARHGDRSHQATLGRLTVVAGFALSMLSGVLGGAPAEVQTWPGVERSDGHERATKSDSVRPVSDDNTAGACNPLNICGDPDCSTASKCSAGCFGPPGCATQCGGSPCNVGCSPGVCGAGCPQECNLATCPQNNCSPHCGDPDCKVACGGSPCNGGCPDRCDAGRCPTNALCLSSCGGNSCNIGCTPCEAGCAQECNLGVCPQNNCSPRCGDPTCKIACGGGPCNGGCPDRCDAGLCPSNALCDSLCGGNPCTVGCTPCGAGCALECDPVVCPENIVDCTWGLLNAVSDQVDSASARTQAATDRATEARNNAADLVDNMQDGLQNLTGEMRARIQDAIETMQQAVLDELAGAADFTNGSNSCSAECEAFRDDLITLLTGLGDISNALLTMAGINGQADLSTEIALVESLSGKALYPLYRVLQTLPLLDEDFLLSMSQAAKGLAEVAPYIEDSVVAGELPDTCRLLTENAELAERIISAAKNINKVGKGFRMAGSVLSSVGKTKIASWGDGWGFAGIRYTGGLLERVGDRIESVGKAVTPVAERVERKLHYCVLKVNGEDLLGRVGTAHEQFISTDQEILDVLASLQAAYGQPGDLNDDGAIDLGDYSLFHTAFGSANLPPP